MDNGERFDKGLWAGHVALALLLGPMFTLMELAPQVGSIVALVYLLAPFIGFRWLLRGQQGPVPEEGPCTRTGSAGSWHWFEWAERPGLRWWTRDAAEAAAIRARREALPRGGLDLQLQPGPDPRGPLQLDLMVRNLVAVSGSMIIGFFAMVIWLAVSGTAEGATGNVVSSLVCVPFTLLPAVIGVWLVYWTMFLGLWGAWHRFVVPARAASIRWTGSQLRTDQGTAYLEEPQAQAELVYGRFGTTLVVDDGKQVLKVRGDHDTLAPLADALQERIDDHSTDEAEAGRAEAWARALRARALEP